MENAKLLWQQTKEQYQKSENIEETVFRETIATITDIHKVQNGYIFLIVGNSLEKFRIEKFYLTKLNEILTGLTAEKMQFKLITAELAEKETKMKESSSPVTTVNEEEKTYRKRLLRPEYTFDNFVTGEANREAFTFSIKVADSPHVTVNPLYIFGDVGLGKTHLMMAIGHYILDNNINANIVYTTAQQFVEDYFLSKNKNQKNPAAGDSFNHYYRSADVLLVDDIQFLSGKTATQEEFFKLFEDLFENNKQIVITSDRPANELDIMARLKSRFSWGIPVDVKKPNFELRKAILKNKLNFLITDPTNVPDEVLEFIANHFEENVRELEGALRRLVYYCVAFNVDYTLENTKIALESIIIKDKNTTNDNNTLYIERIKNFVAAYFNVNVKDLSSNSRKQELVYARNIAIYLLRTKYNLPLKKIGEFFGGRDHATIAHAYDKIADAFEKDSSVRQDIDNILSKIDKKNN